MGNATITARKSLFGPTASSGTQNFTLILPHLRHQFSILKHTALQTGEALGLVKYNILLFIIVFLICKA